MRCELVCWRLCNALETTSLYQASPQRYCNALQAMNWSLRLRREGNQGVDAQVCGASAPVSRGPCTNQASLKRQAAGYKKKEPRGLPRGPGSPQLPRDYPRT